MSVSPPISRTRSSWRSRKARSWSVAWTMKSARSRAASAASSPSMSFRFAAIPIASFQSAASEIVRDGPLVAVILEVGSHSLSKEHRVVPFEQPLAGTMPEGTRRLVRFELVQCRVIRQVEQDHVVEVPAVGHVVPAHEPDPELLLVLAHLPGKQRAHEELEERVTAAANSEVGREHRHAADAPPGSG